MKTPFTVKALEMTQHWLTGCMTVQQSLTWLEMPSLRLSHRRGSGTSHGGTRFFGSSCLSSPLRASRRLAPPTLWVIRSPTRPVSWWDIRCIVERSFFFILRHADRVCLYKGELSGRPHSSLLIPQLVSSNSGSSTPVPLTGLDVKAGFSLSNTCCTMVCGLKRAGQSDWCF